jgi:PTH1 family peptidyl-tRNA hydrolase
MENLYLVVGLGNPGREYARTRHNAGFQVVDRLSDRWRAVWTAEKRFNSRLARREEVERRVILCQPQTFMNASGEAVGGLSRFYQIQPSRILVVVDDADLPLGQIRMRPGGSSGGHHGLDSIEQQLGTRDYPRLRVGIGRRPGEGRQIRQYVLGQFAADEQEIVETVLNRAVQQVECWLDAGIQEAMNRFNGAAAAPLDRGNTE